MAFVLAALLCAALALPGVASPAAAAERPAPEGCLVTLYNYPAGAPRIVPVPSVAAPRPEAGREREAPAAPPPARLAHRPAEGPPAR